MIILSYNSLFLYREIQDKFIWIQKHGLLKRNFEQRIFFYVVRFKIRQEFN